MADLKDFAEKLVNLTVKEVSELADILKEEYGIEPAASAPVAVAGAAAAAGGDAADEKTEFTVVLKAAGGSKLAVVKLVKELTGLGGPFEMGEDTWTCGHKKVTSTCFLRTPRTMRDLYDLSFSKYSEP